MVNNEYSNDVDRFDRLLESMPRIAEAVNAFSSKKNQRAALDALVFAIGVRPSNVAGMDEISSASTDRSAEERLEDESMDDEVETSSEATRSSAEVSKPNGSSISRRRRTPSRKWEPVRDLDFRPAGKQAFREFVAEKQPTTIDQKNIAAVWWLEQIAEIQEIGVGHVLAAYKDCDWREPSHPDNSLQVTASREHWLDTKNMKAIVTTPSGRNFVQFDMPLKKDKQA